MSNVITRMIWTVVYRQDPTSPQQEYIRYTPEAADHFAKEVMDNGGVAVVVEGEEVVNVAQFRAGKNTIEW